jgi:hypothetical protein
VRDRLVAHVDHVGLPGVVEMSERRHVAFRYNVAPGTIPPADYHTSR